MSVDAYQALLDDIEAVIRDDDYTAIGKAETILATVLLNHKLAVLNHLGTTREGYGTEPDRDGRWHAGGDRHGWQDVIDPDDPLQRGIWVSFGAAAKDGNDA